MFKTILKRYRIRFSCDFAVGDEFEMTMRLGKQISNKK